MLVAVVVWGNLPCKDGSEKKGKKRFRGSGGSQRMIFHFRLPSLFGPLVFFGYTIARAKPQFINSEEWEEWAEQG